MMISKKMQDELNKQVNAELYASYLYLAMSAYFEDVNFGGFAKWMKAQSSEEYGHAMKIYDYLTRVGAKVELDSIQKPKLEWSSALEAFEDALEHEKKVTKMIDDLTNLAIEEKDHSTNIFLHWFVEEQVEEVDTAQNIVDTLNMIGDNKSALFMYDRQTGSREG
jgi:ferritin